MRARRGAQPPPGAARRALDGDRRRREIVSAQLQQPTSGTYIDPANERVLRNFTLDPRDPKRLTATVPPGFEGTARNESWVLYARC